jgi:hypothetical protein
VRPRTARRATMRLTRATFRRGGRYSARSRYGIALQDSAGSMIDFIALERNGRRSLCSRQDCSPGARFKLTGRESRSADHARAAAYGSGARSGKDLRRRGSVLPEKLGLPGVTPQRDCGLEPRRVLGLTSRGSSRGHPVGFPAANCIIALSPAEHGLARHHPGTAQTGYRPADFTGATSASRRR